MVGDVETGPPEEAEEGHDAPPHLALVVTADAIVPPEPMSVLDQFPAAGERRLAVRVTDDALRWIRSGHPWLFEDSITSVSGDGQPGDLAVVFDRERRFRAIGLYDPTSPIRVKLLHHGDPVQITPAWFQRRIGDALDRRRGLLESTETTGVRCVNGENDGLPGLIVDLYGAVAVVKVYSPAWLAHLRSVVPPLESLLGVSAVVLRLSRRTQREIPEGITDGMVLLGSAPTGPVLFRENGLRVEADVVTGNKTGYFLDQRDNRRLVGEACRGAQVLDVFSSSGGFSLAAAAGGATSVLSVDISSPALEAARRNFAHNRGIAAVRRCRHDTRHGDAFEVMAELAARGDRFDVVVVDPPSFAQSEAAVPKALRAYERLTGVAVGLVADGGLLVQASCSSRVSPADFFEAVASGARRAGVELTELRRTGHPGDHAVGFRQGEYLKAVFARIHRPKSRKASR
ncbi:MAG TPA: class I SAM-dependent rRNA methyltransferase [Acidimicrobiales bacterium]|nr:class I SAM-dependent rRNA methyltransferase [Acidimicrobiales bacterium]